MFRFAFVFVLAVASAFAQDKVTAEQFYQRCGSTCDPGTGIINSKSSNRAASIGDEVYGYLRSSTGEFARRGEEFRLFFDVVKPYERPVTLYGRRAKLNKEGNWERFDYFSAESGDQGWFPSLRQGQFSILLFSGRVSGDQQVGDAYDFDVVIVDSMTGTLLQQAFTGYSVGVQRGINGRGFNYLDRASLVGQDASAYVVLDGLIPTWSDLAVEFIAPDQFMVNTPLPMLVQSPSTPPTIRQVQLKLGVFNPAATAVDVVMVVKVTRRHFTLPKAFVVNPTPSNQSSQAVPTPQPPSTNP